MENTGGGCVLRHSCHEAHEARRAIPISRKCLPRFLFQPFVAICGRKHRCKLRESRVDVDCQAQADYVTCDYSTPSEAGVLTITNDHDSASYVVC